MKDFLSWHNALCCFSGYKETRTGVALLGRRIIISVLTKQTDQNCILGARPGFGWCHWWGSGLFHRILFLHKTWTWHLGDRSKRDFALHLLTEKSCVVWCIHTFTTPLYLHPLMILVNTTHHMGGFFFLCFIVALFDLRSRYISFQRTSFIRTRILLPRIHFFE